MNHTPSTVVDFPTERCTVAVYRDGKWVTLPDGLKSVVKGDIFRMYTPTAEDVITQPNGDNVVRPGAVGIALEDGHPMTNKEKKLVGGCECEFYSSLAEALAAA